MNDASFDNITSAVKLVIWDLDETFWKGTLSEGGIEAVQAHTDMVRTLVDRGIMCAICSKNDFEDAKKALEEIGIWMRLFSLIFSGRPKARRLPQ